MNSFANLSDLQDHFNDKIIDTKYEQAIALLNMLTDEEYETVWNSNKEIMDPIATDEGDNYLHDELVLDTLISVFSDVIAKREKEANEELLQAKIITNIINAMSDMDLADLVELEAAVKNILVPTEEVAKCDEPCDDCTCNKD